MFVCVCMCVCVCVCVCVFRGSSLNTLCPTDRSIDQNQIC